MQYDSIVVGSGLAGATVARRLAEEKGQKVLVLEKKRHIGGFCYDERNEDGCLIQRYGPHIFRTNSKKVWDFLSRFTAWHDYQHKVLTCVNGQFYPMPINLDTINGVLGTQYTSENVLSYFEEHALKYPSVKTVKEAIESQVGTLFYELFYRNYTQKQWGLPCEKLPPEIISRIPIRQNRDDRYFTHKYQALPKNGYTNLIGNLLDHPNIHILLQIDFNEVKQEFRRNEIYYSGSIDAFFDDCYGKLPYRCVNFEFEKLDREWFQPAAVVNYPNNYDYTRITEFKHFYGHPMGKGTVIAKEYPSGGGELSYPIPLPENQELYQKYYAKKKDTVHFIGRLGRYRYYSMDQIVEEILEMAL